VIRRAAFRDIRFLVATPRTQGKITAAFLSVISSTYSHFLLLPQSEYSLDLHDILAMGRILKRLVEACLPTRHVYRYLEQRPARNPYQRQTTVRKDDIPFNTTEQFIATYLEDFTQCCICFEAFDHDKHTPTRFTGPNACAHVFGGSCLRRWLRSAIAGTDVCPICRRQLYYRLDGPPVISTPVSDNSGIALGVVEHDRQGERLDEQIEPGLLHMHREIFFHTSGTN
jgi:hypothetical protein